MISKSKYWINRFSRIYPVYFLALVFVAIYYYGIDRSIFTSFNLRFPFELLLLQSWIGKTSLNFPGWSLSVELFFYLCFPFFIFWFSRKRSFRLAILGLLLFLIGQLLYFYIANKFPLNSRLRLAFDYFPLLNISTFAIGGITGILWVRHQAQLTGKLWLSKLIAYGLACIGFLLIIRLLDFNNLHHNGLLSLVYSCFLIGFSLPSAFTRVLGNKYFVYLGDISYSIYILQYPVWLFYRYCFKQENGWQGYHFWGYLVGLIVVSAFVYSTYEKKMQQYFRTILTKTKE